MVVLVSMNHSYDFRRDLQTIHNTMTMIHSEQLITQIIINYLEDQIPGRCEQIC